MKAVLTVATLIAPSGTDLAEDHIKNFADRIVESGGVVHQVNSLDKNKAADIYFAGAAHITKNDLPFDVLIQPLATRCKKILLADMESTIIEQEMLDELASEIGLGEKVAAITRRAMNGELDFVAALTERVRLFKGQSENLLYEAAARMTFSNGARDLLVAMKRAGGKSWLVSGGFTFFIKRIAEQLGFDGYYGNNLIVEDGLITGEISSPILGQEAKKELLLKACSDYGLTLADVVAIGDGANDVSMLQTCHEGGGLGVAYHAKPRVREVIHSQINHSDLSALIYAQGLA